MINIMNHANWADSFRLIKLTVVYLILRSAQIEIIDQRRVHRAAH